MAEIRETKDTRRAAARAKAAADRDAANKRRRRNRALVQVSIGAVVVAIVAIIALVVTSSVQHAANADPKNMASDGIVITKGLTAVRTAAIKDSKPIPTKTKSDVVQIDTYIDYRCPFCKQFESANADYLAAEINAGRVEVAIHPVAILTNGSDYSIRSGSAAACVANYDPDKFWAYSQALYANQPEETNTAGLKNSKLAELAKSVGADSSDINSCIRGGQYKGWIQQATLREKITSTPTVLIDGTAVDAATVLTADAFTAAVKAAEQKKNLL